MDKYIYYTLEADPSFATPFLTVDEDVDIRGINFLSKSMTVPDDYVAHLMFDIPIPSTPQMVDFLILDGGRCVFSKKIYDALKEKKIKGLQLVPVIIRDKNGDDIENYFVANVYQKFSFFDKDKTKYGHISKLTGDWDDIEKVVLSKEKLDEIPLEDRLVFVSKENSAFILFHKSIVDIIMSVNPEGIIPIDIEKWYDGIDFDL